ncbi:MAG: acyl-CoA thioesterase [Gammaproteobacteria bacterium]|nr:acyl-CoA thioesterase [Gammaproteobacteria bacterium]
MCRELLPDYPAIIEQPVSWGEMDSLGHVNNIVYFRYFESARMEYFKHIAFADPLQKLGVGPILAETQCRFRAALAYPDFIAVGARVTEILDDRFKMQYAVASHALNRIAAEGSGLVVSYDYRKHRKALLPPEIIENIRSFESKNPERK